MAYNSAIPSVMLAIPAANNRTSAKLAVPVEMKLVFIGINTL